MRVGWPTRLFAYGVVLAVLAAPVADVEAWPFSTLELFSNVRRPLQGGWEVAAVSADGREGPVPWGRLPRSFRFHQHLVARFPDLDPAERQRICTPWIEALRAAGRADVSRLRIYRVDRRTPSDEGERAVIVRRRLRFECEVFDL